MPSILEQTFETREALILLGRAFVASLTLYETGNTGGGLRCLQITTAKALYETAP